MFDSSSARRRLGGPVPRRLEKFLRDATELSLEHGKKALAQGQVKVFQPEQTEPIPLRFDDLVFPEDAVWLGHQRLEVRTRHETLLLNKPRDVTSTVRDPLGERDLSEFIEVMPPGVFPVGRLDRDTTGLLLFTNDGDLAQAILRPEHKTDKVYILSVAAKLEDDDPRLARMLEGVDLAGALARAVSVEVLQRTAAGTELQVTLQEGKNRQIRRMCRVLNLRLQRLHRRAIGPLEVGKLALGEFRPLTARETETLWTATGGELRVVQRKFRALVERAQDRRQRGLPDLRLETWLARADLAQCRR